MRTTKTMLGILAIAALSIGNAVASEGPQTAAFSESMLSAESAVPPADTASTLGVATGEPTAKRTIGLDQILSFCVAVGSETIPLSECIEYLDGEDP